MKRSLGAFLSLVSSGLPDNFLGAASGANWANGQFKSMSMPIDWTRSGVNPGFLWWFLLAKVFYCKPKFDGYMLVSCAPVTNKCHLRVCNQCNGATLVCVV